MARWMTGLVFAALMVLAGTAEAQRTLRIAAIVNDEVITVFDLESRLSLVMVSSRVENRPEIRKRLAPQVLRTLIDDKLKVQEARRLNITVSEEEIGKAMAQIEKRNRLRPGGLEAFLKRSGIDRSAMADQIEAEISWSKVVGRRLRGQIHVGQDEVDAMLQEIRDGKGKPEVLVSEIFLGVDTPEREREVRGLLDRLVQQLRAGANFGALARSFSESATAAVGGDLGWIKADQLGAELEKAVLALQRGQASQPIRTLAGYHILALRDRREASGRVMGVGETKVTLQQLFLPLLDGVPQEQIAAKMQEARNLAAAARNCNDLDELGKRTGSKLSGALGTVKVSGLPAQLRAVVGDLPVDKPSEPMRTNGGVIVLMVCDRTGAATVDAEKARIRASLEQQRLDVVARRHLRNLRRQAFVDMRI